MPPTPHGSQGGAPLRHRFGALVLLSLSLACSPLVGDAQALVTSTTTSAQYTVNSGSDALAVPFYFLSAGDLVVKSGLNGVLVNGTGYAVTMPATDGAGGTVTLIGQTPSDTITITRQLAYTQPTQLRGQGVLSPPVLENSYDRATMQIQQLQAEITTLQTIVQGLNPDAGIVTQAKFFQSASGTGGVQMWDASLNGWQYLYSSAGSLKQDNAQPP